MDNKNFKVMGIVSGVSTKSGSPKPYTMLHLVRDFEQNNSQVKKGQECLVQYIANVIDTNINVGSLVDFDYTIGGNGFPKVCGVKLVK